MKNSFRRSAAIVLSVVMMAGALSSCKGSTPNQQTSSGAGSELVGTSSVITASLVASNDGASAQSTASGSQSDKSNQSSSKTVSSKSSGNADLNNYKIPNPSKEYTKKKVTITIGDSKNNEALKKAIEDYKKVNPNTTVVVEDRGKFGISDLQEAVAVKTAPDIVYMDQVYSVSSGSRKLLADLNKYGAKSITSNFITPAVQSVSYGGKMYALPFDANTIAFFYNKDMLKAAGVAAPTNYSELVNASKKVNEKNGNRPKGYTAPFYDGNNNNWKAFNYFFYLWRMGGEILTSDLKKAAFNSKAGIDALQMILDMRKSNITTPTYRESSFMEGNIAMIDNGSWQMNTLFGDKKAANFGISLLPTLKQGVPRYSGLGLACYGVTSTCKEPQAAYDFLEFYSTNTKYQLEYCKTNNMIPSIKKAHSDPFYSSAEWKVMIQQLETSKYRPSVPNWEKIEILVAEAVVAAVEGKKTPKQALDAAASSVNNLLK
jgi:multiple sugar transport system substrate-binding protein